MLLSTNPWRAGSVPNGGLKNSHAPREFNHGYRPALQTQPRIQNRLRGDSMSTQRRKLRLRDRKAYRLARRFLLKTKGVTEEMIKDHLDAPDSHRPETLCGVFSRLVFSAQNYWALPHIIGCKLGTDGTDELAGILSDFDPTAVFEEFGTKWKRLLNRIDEDFFPTEPRSREPRSAWRKFCRAVLTGAKWLTQFKDVNTFYQWVERHDRNARKRYELACTIASNVRGYGPALACDFVKELGFLNWSKPDVHLKKIFVGLGLATSEDNWTVFRAIDRLARNVGVSPYHADKVFWLISSGRFYRTQSTVCRSRDRFIRYAAKRLDVESV
jgi:hypothetical protein